MGAPRSYVIVFDAAAVIDLEDVKSKGERKAVFNAVHKLKELGPALPSPHMILAVAASKDRFDRAVADARERIERRR